MLTVSLADTCSAQGLSLAVNGLPVDAPPALEAEPAETFSFDLQVVNSGGSTTSFSSAQATLLLRPLIGAIGEIDIDVAMAPSAFGSSASGITDPTDGALTVQAGAIVPVSLAEGAGGSFAQLDLLLPAEASGDFELIALEFDPVNFLRSSHWLPPGGLGLPLPTPMPFENALESPGGGLLLATISISSVPEPPSGLIAVLVSLGIALRRRVPLP